MRTHLGLCILLSVAAPGKAGTPALHDPGYLGRPLAKQSEPPGYALDPVVAPTPSTPALVTWGDRLEVRVLLPPGEAPGRPGDWLMALTTRTRGPLGRMIGVPVPQRYVLSVDEVTAGSSGTAVVLATIPADPPRDVYHLEVAGPGGLRGSRVHAVRVLGGSERLSRFRFVLAGDHQLRDPSTHFSGADLNNGDYPRQGENDADSMFIQQVEEMDFLDPDFVLHVGDLVFGIDYNEEYPATLERWWARPLAACMVPGNHDGHALYELALKEGWWREALKSVRCARYLLDGEVTAVGVFRLLECLLGDLKKILFEDLAQDGLDHWRRLLGSTDFSFDLGRFHFVGVNTYAGTAERRHAFVLSLGFLGIDLGAATVDNYGGTLTPAQLAWLSRDLAEATRADKTVVVFLHHDPRGNNEMPWGQRFHENMPFPTEPLGLRKFQEWNYEGREWDSDPEDTRGPESQTENSAVALLRLIARHASYVLSGHIHDDRDDRVPAGQEIVTGSGIMAARDIQFIRVTTGSSTPDDEDGYWGYRLLASAGPELTGRVFQPEWGWGSMPAGNFWVVGSGVPPPSFVPGEDTDVLFVVHNGLPVELNGRLRAYLADVPEGYRFPASAGDVRVVDVGRGEGGVNVYYLAVRLPKIHSGLVPPPKGEDVRAEIRVERASGNRTPVVSFTTDGEDIVPGRKVRFDGSATRDPEGKPLAQYVWHFGDGASARGRVAYHAYDRLGEYSVSLTAIDEHGAFARFATRVEVTSPPSCSFGGSACAATAGTLLVFALVAGIRWWRRRSRRNA